MYRRANKSAHFFCLLFMFFLLISSIQAEEATEMVTDRPDQTESSVTIPPGYVQIETGLTLTESGNTHITEGPGTLFRIGVSNRIEARIGFAGWISENANDTNGFGDSELSAKVFLREEKGYFPEVAILAGMSVPTGEDGFTSDNVDPGVRLACAHTLSDRLALGYNLAIEWITGLDDMGKKDTLTFLPYTCGIGIGLTDRIGSYVEFFGELPLEDEGDAAHLFNCGFTYKLMPNIQLDAEGGVGISDKADDWFIGTGISYRIPR